MTRFISAIYHPKIKAAEFIAEDGRHLIRSGGSLPWRTNNVGNLVSPAVNGAPAPKKTKGYIGFAKPSNSDHYFFIFPSQETGRGELKASLVRKHGGKSLEELVATYAPQHENDTRAYAKNLSKLSGIDPQKKIGDLSEKELDSLADGIATLEGFHADTESRKELWVNVSHIQATDGIRPLADEQIVLRANGKDEVLKANATGQFGGIPHGTEPIEVLHKSSSGNLKKVGELSPDKSQRLMLLIKWAEFFGKTAPVKPPPAVSDRKQPITYVVKPNDSLVKIGKRFGLSVDEIKKSNQLKSDLIVPGQVLGIHQSAATAVPPTLAKKTTTGGGHPDSNATGLVLARSKKGAGEPIALIPPEEGSVPWMKYALSEAKRHHGNEEREIQKAINYHVELEDGRSSMEGTLNAWCAAFVNWCLVQAKYPIRNPKESGFLDWSAAVMRADGFNRLRGKKTDAKQKYESVPFVRNPLYVQVNEPCYGAIAVVTSPSGVGQHVGFVYAREDDNSVVLLGGNQGDQINFTSFNEKPVPPSARTISGKKVVVKGKPNHLKYFVPVSYVEQYNKSPKELHRASCKDLNATIGIASKNAKHGSSTR